MPHVDTELAQIVEAREPDLTWRHLLTTSHNARATRFDLHVCRESHGQLRVFVFKDREFASYLIDPKHDVRFEAGSEGEGEGERVNMADLLDAAIKDIDSNEFQMY